MFYSPLRYPGGKNKLATFISSICELNKINGHYVEPYAGGASVALYLLIENKVAEITINDVDRSIYALWYSLLKRTNKFCSLIETTEINLENWKRAKEVQKNKKNASLLDLGFSTFFLNRTNRSGIIEGGPIGGYSQNGTYKLDCRFNKQNLISRIRLIAKHKKRIHLFNMDAPKLMRKIVAESQDSNTVFYLDPPYYLKGQSLYMNYYEHKDHKEISDLVQSLKNVHWIVSYDNTDEIKELYKNVNKKREYTLTHSAYKSKKGKEIMFFSEKLDIGQPIAMCG